MEAKVFWFWYKTWKIFKIWLIFFTFCLGVGLCATTLPPRTLQNQEGEELIDLQMFEMIKENSLLCQICTGIYFKPKSAGNCLHKFCEACIDRYIKRM